MNGIIRVNAGHNLIVIANPTSIPLVLDGNFNPIQTAQLVLDISRALGGTKKHSLYFKAVHAGNEELTKQLEPAIEPDPVKMSIGVGRILRPWNRKSGDDNVAHRLECSSRVQPDQSRFPIPAPHPTKNVTLVILNLVKAPATPGE